MTVARGSRSVISARFGANAPVLAALALPLAFASPACSAGGPSPTHDALPPGVAARVAGDDVRVATVARIVRAQGVSAREARRRAIADALFAAAVRADPGQVQRLAAAERSVLARALLERLRDDAMSSGPASDAELDAVLAQRWVELDRPPSVATAHAVVLVKTPADDAPAHALALALARALAGIRSGDELVTRALAFPHGALEIRAEHLPPVTPDGRIWDPDDKPPKPLGATLDLDFTRAAQALVNVGDQSGVVKSAFGYHVILLERRYPELRLSRDEQRARLTGDIQARRAKAELDALTQRLRAATPVSTDRAAEALTALVPVTP